MEQVEEMRRLLIAFHTRGAERAKRGHAKNSCMAAYCNDVLARFTWYIQRLTPDELTRHLTELGVLVNGNVDILKQEWE